jgi:hypothetical protein
MPIWGPNRTPIDSYEQEGLEGLFDKRLRKVCPTVSNARAGWKGQCGPSYAKSPLRAP